MKNFEPRWLLVILSCNFLLATLLCWINQLLPIWSIHLFLPAAYVLLPAFYLRSLSAFLCAAVTGLGLDAVLLTPFGSHCIVLVLGTTLVLAVRNRLRRESKLQVLFCGFLLNAVLFAFFSAMMFLALEQRMEILLGGRLIVDLFFSQAVFILITSWHLDFQTAILRLIGIRVEAAG